ncbi:MAG: type II secretion system minor pseudopilin GspJ [Succinivibrionaceae bacterium]|nr:type II secretion system minor pseudopilin GspJ [Succinivibrionaceae bacterium]
MRNRGFTLIEVMISIFIFSILATGAYEILGSAVMTDEISGKKMQRLGEIQRAVNLLDHDFEQMAYRRNRYPSYGSTRYIWAEKNIFNSDDWGVEFVRSGFFNPGAMLDRNELQRVVYRLKDNNLERGTYSRSDPVQNQQPKWEVVISHVTNFELRFRVALNSLAWYQSINSNRLPVGVEMNLTLDDVGKIRREYYVVHYD